MDQLNNINANDGFPLCAETLQVLYDNAVLANRMLSGLRLSNNTAIILHEFDAIGNIFTGYAYVYMSQGGNRIVKYERSTSVQFSSAKIIITSTSQNVSVNQHTYQNVYVTESAIIGTENTDANKWKFYWLNEVIEPAMFEDKLSDLTYGGASNGVTFSATPDLVSNAENIFSRNGSKMRIKLAISLNATAFANGDIFKYNIDTISINEFTHVIYTGMSGLQPKYITNGVAYPVNAIMKISGSFYGIEAYIYADNLGSKLYFEIGKMAALNGFTQVGGHYSANGTIYVNSEVLL